jgi:hypothetical protein
METINEQIVSLLLQKEADIIELKNMIIQLQTNLQITQQEYNKLYRLYYLRKNKVKKAIRKRIGFQTKKEEVK